MCNWSENLIEDSLEKGMERGMERGIERGMERGIQIFILDNLEENISPMRILEKLQRRFQLDQEKANSYFQKYACAGAACGPRGE